MDTCKVKERIKKELKLQNKTAKQMCEDIGVSINTVTELQIRKRGMRIDTLYLICRYLNISSDYILGLSKVRRMYK